MAKAHELARFGTADIVTTFRVVRQARFGGLDVWQVVGEDSPSGDEPLIFIKSNPYSGLQARMVLAGHDEGFHDWLDILERNGKPCDVKHSVVGADWASKDLEAQWLTHGPSELLNQS